MKELRDLKDLTIHDLHAPALLYFLRSLTFEESERGVQGHLAFRNSPLP